MILSASLCKTCLCHPTSFAGRISSTARAWRLCKKCLLPILPYPAFFYRVRAAALPSWDRSFRSSGFHGGGKYINKYICQKKYGVCGFFINLFFFTLIFV